MSKIDPVDPGENGNIVSLPKAKKVKQVAPKCKYDFVYNNYKSEEIPLIEIVLKQICKRYLFGEEIGKEGTPHLQGFIDLKTKMRMSELVKIILYGFSYRECRNETALIEYCKKDGKVKSFGFPKPLKIIQKLHGWQEEIVKIISAEPDGRTLHWYVDTIGGKGKSSFCKYLFVKYKCLIIQGGKLADIMNIIFNTNMDDVTSVIIDVPRINKNKISYASVECILNGMITNTKYETGIKVFNPPHVIVFSNYHPNTDGDVLSKDRWKITDLDAL